MTNHNRPPHQSLPLATTTHAITRQPARPICISIFITLFLSIGCANDQNTATISPNSPNSPLAQVDTDYRSGRFANAYQNAVEIYKSHSTGSPIRIQAAYLAGLSAYQLKKYDEADQYLRPLRKTPDNAIAGNASATLGLIAREQNHPAEAVILFKNAYRKLSDQDKAEAAYQTALAYRDLNQTAQARQQFLLARAASHDPEFRSQVDQYILNTGWTIQLGAFANISNAQKKLAEYNNMTASHTLGPARILQQSNHAGTTTLYLVRIGNFMDYNLAARARSKITGPAVITTIQPKS